MTAGSTRSALAVGSFEVTGFADTSALDDDSVVDTVETFSDSESSGFDGAGLAVGVDILASGIHADIINFDITSSGVAAAGLVLRTSCSSQHSEFRATQAVD